MNGKKLIFLTCALLPAMERAGCSGGPDTIAKAKNNTMLRSQSYVEVGKDKGERILYCYNIHFYKRL